MNRSSLFYFMLIMVTVSIHSVVALQRTCMRKLVRTTTQPAHLLIVCNRRNFSSETLIPFIPYIPLISSILSSLLVSSMPDIKKPTEKKESKK